MQALPDLVRGGVSLIFLALGAGIVAMQTGLAAAAAARLAGGRSHPARWAAGVGVYLSVWLGLAMVFGDPQHVRWGANPQGRAPLGLALGFGPVLIAVATLFASRGLQ